MNILTWNINGIRAGRERKNLKDLFDSLNADVISLQETKVTRDMLDEPTAIVEGYDSYFSFSRKRSGYSGTANYCNHLTGPEKAEEGLTGRLTNSTNDSCVGCYGDMITFTEEDLEALDAEGRCVITQHNIRLSEEVKSLAIINVYVPRSGDREDRHQYKIKFLSALQSRAEALLDQGVHVIILGDLNLTHRRLDNCDPSSDEEFMRSSSRIWLNAMLQQSERDSTLPKSDGTLAELAIPGLAGGRFSDIYRRLHPDKAEAFTNWNTATDARKANYGRRLDYILADTRLAEFATSCQILADVEGSDHCPVVLRLDAKSLHHQPCPALCSKLMPEFKGKQQKLSSFFSKSGKDIVVDGISSKHTTNSSDTDKGPKSPVKKALSLPLPSLAKHTSQKRSADTPVKASSNAKRSKLKKDASLPKQISLTSFFSKTSPTPVPLIKNNKSVTEGQCESIAYNERTEDTKTARVPPISNTSDISADTSPQVNSVQEIMTLDTPVHLARSETAKVANNGLKPVTTHGANLAKVDVNNVSKLPSSQEASKASSSQAWKSLLQGLPPPPLCPGHQEECVLKTVKKSGPNKSRQFYTCPRPDGAPGKPEFRCNFFQWLDERRKKNKS